MEMGYLTVLHVRLGAKIGDLHAKDSHSFRKRLIGRPKDRKNDDSVSLQEALEPHYIHQISGKD
jgi:hypothetical protein